MTRKKIRDRENRKILSGFRDVADFVTGNRDSIPPLVGPFKLIQIFDLKGVFKSKTYQKRRSVLDFTFGTD